MEALSPDRHHDSSLGLSSTAWCVATASGRTGHGFFGSPSRSACLPPLSERPPAPAVADTCSAGTAGGISWLQISAACLPGIYVLGHVPDYELPRAGVGPAGQGSCSAPEPRPHCPRFPRRSATPITAPTALSATSALFLAPPAAPPPHVRVVWRASARPRFGLPVFYSWRTPPTRGATCRQCPLLCLFPRVVWPADARRIPHWEWTTHPCSDRRLNRYVPLARASMLGAHACKACRRQTRTPQGGHQTGHRRCSKRCHGRAHSPQAPPHRPRPKRPHAPYAASPHTLHRPADPEHAVRRAGWTNQRDEPLPVGKRHGLVAPMLLATRSAENTRCTLGYSAVLGLAFSPTSLPSPRYPRLPSWVCCGPELAPIVLLAPRR